MKTKLEKINDKAAAKMKAETKIAELEKALANLRLEHDSAQSPVDTEIQGAISKVVRALNKLKGVL